MISTRLLMGGGSSFPTPESSLLALYNGSLNASLYAIGAATKTPSGTWTTYVSNPVIQVGSGGTWEDEAVKDPCLLWDGSQFICYYAGYDGALWKIGRATASSHEGPWTKAGGNPLLTVGAGGSFDDAAVNFPTVLREDATTWHMWYGASDGSLQTIGYASSSDGLSWTKFGQVLTVGTGWEDEGVLPMAIYKDGATYNLFYGGRQGTTNPRWQGGLATFSSPTGTYTKDAGNPILLARFNDAGTSQLLTLDSSAGSAIVTVSSTAAWNVGESMAIADGNSETEIRTIASVDSGTQITFTTACTSTFTVAAGGTIRPFAYNAVLPRTVRPAFGGGYEMFGTPFQPVEDLSPGGTKLREGSLRWTAPALDGPWSYDYVTGLLFPLNLSSWDGKSAENPSVIVTP